MKNLNFCYILMERLFVKDVLIFLILLHDSRFSDKTRFTKGERMWMTRVRSKAGL